MKRDGLLRRVLRISWPLLGGAWGAWLGFGGYLAISHNADSFGSVLALGFFAVFALVGLAAGAACGALIGGLVDAVMLRSGVGTAGAVITATLVNALALWQIADLVQARYPGLRADGPAKHLQGNPGARSPAAATPGSSTPGTSSRTSCAEPPPTQPKERGIWDFECR
jgi:hypothetical protein